MDNSKKTLNKREVIMGHAYVFLFFFLICIFIWILKESQIIFKPQNTKTCLIYKLFSYFSIPDHLTQIFTVNSCHHVNIYACFHCTHCCFFSVCTISVINGLPSLI